MISVIIPMYNSENTIIRALNSVKKQTEINSISEIIVVNDGSNDNSLEELYNYCEMNKDMPIKVINKENGGVSSARNAGLKVAKGEYIALLDSDDEWLPKKIESQLNILRENSNIDFLGCNRNNETLKILFKKINKLHKANINELIIKMFPQTSTAIFKKSIIEKIGYYDENQKYAEDGNYWFRICSEFNFYIDPISLVITDGGKPSFGFSGLSRNLKGMYQGNIKNIKELKELKQISRVTYLFAHLYYWIKYIRRIIITKLR